MKQVIINGDICYSKGNAASAIGCTRKECGYSIYRGILVRWDEDQDERSLRLIDAIPTAVAECQRLFRAYEDF
jgi:hypothetical protein